MANKRLVQKRVRDLRSGDVVVGRPWLAPQVVKVVTKATKDGQVRVKWDDHRYADLSGIKDDEVVIVEAD